MTIEQHINLIDQEYSTTGTTLPENNSLGLIRWDGDKYNGESVYFEAILRCDTCSDGNTRAVAELYTAGGSPVTNGAVNTTSSTYTRARAVSAVTSNLVNGTDYTVRLSLDAVSGTAYLKAARLIVIQSASTITDTEGQIELGNNANTVNGSYETMPAPKVFNYDGSQFAPAPTINFEATLKSSDDSGIAYAMVTSSSTCESTVSGGELTVTGQTWTRARTSSSISLVSGNSYFICIKTSSGHVASIANAKLIFDQSNSLGIAKTEIYHQMVNTLATHNDSTYTAKDFSIEYDPDHFAGANFSYYFEATMKTSGDTGYARLNNLTGTNVSPVETVLASYDRPRSPEITGIMPSSTTDIDTEISNSGTSTTTVSTSWLVTQMTAYPQMSFVIEAVSGNTATNGVTTTTSSQENKLDFGFIGPNSPIYLAHKLTATTNTSAGYTVTMKLANTLQGNYPANIIESFPAEWTAPEDWETPDGTTANVNTGWIGANTSDTRVPNWGSASGKFAGIGTTANIVMQSSGIDAGTSIYVTYALEVNQHQPQDLYYGNLVYNIVPTY